MTLLYVDGFDNGDFASRWVVTQAGLTISAVTTTPFGAGKGLQRISASGGGNNSLMKKTITASAQVQIGFWFQFADVAHAANVILAQVMADSGAVVHAGLGLNGTNGTLFVFRGTIATVLASGTTQFNPGQWYFVEFKTTIADSGGIANVVVSGSSEISFTGDTRNAGTSTNIDTVQLWGTAGTNVQMLLDDIYIANGLGSVNNDFLGAMRIQTLNPNAAGTDSGLTTTGSANHYANVSDQTTTTYNASPTATTRDSYALPDLAGTTASIFGIQTVMAAQNSDAGAGSMKAVVRSGGTNYYDATQVLSASIVYSAVVRETDPATSAAWTVTNVNALQVGAEVV